MRIRLAVAAGLALAVAAVFAPVLPAGFVYDDAADVVDNPAATPEGFAAALGRTNRPLVKATYAAQRAVHGAWAPGYRAVNLALHLAAAAALFAWVRRLLAARGEARAEPLAALVAAAWALHPAAVEAVAPVSARSVPLSGALVLAALLAVTGERAPRGAALAVAFAAAFAAPLARETALVLPAFVALWCATLGAGEAWRERARRLLPPAAGAALAAVAIAASARHRELLAFSLETRGPLDALRGNVHALFEIARLWLAPAALSVDPPAPGDAPWGAGATLVRAGALAAAALFAVVARRRAPLAAFAAGWTLLALAPTNSIVWRLDPVAPRALYLAALGPLLLAAAGVGRLLAARARSPLRRLAAPAAVAAALAAVGAAAASAHERSALYADPVALWADAAAKAPAKARPQSNLGVELLLAGRLDEAEAAFRRAVALDPGAVSARCALDAIRIRRLSDPVRSLSHQGGTE